jgi:hypothetical protein
MTPTERERVKAALQLYREQHQISVHDLAAQINAEGRKLILKPYIASLISAY